ncbi:hypothetical protein INT47_002990 [Mucor saturninus]|uniref:Tc1-like transposase DDE domain-containing protein n=1 Tax=Mucor saturninus TaxID=64648 RepID=A0A8H7UZN1_9FUNG|nr:hypothetical protein INT47_002990 [Mucor saturninus]
MSRVAKFMKEQYNLSMKVVSRHPVARNKEGNFQRRADWVEKWVQNGWSPRSLESMTETPSTKATSHTVLGAISAIYVVNIKLMESGVLKRKKVMNFPKEGHLRINLLYPRIQQLNINFGLFSDIMDFMDEFSEMKGYFIVMYNAPIHVPEIIDPIIMQQVYAPVYLSPYSPELNSNEQFWSIIKGKVRRTKLSDRETLLGE